MSLIKKTKDHFLKFIFGSTIVPRGLFELNQYFRLYGPIAFNIEKSEDGLVAISDNYRYGSIITSGKNIEELDNNIKDAILTSFEVPSSYVKEARIFRQDERRAEYALA